MGGSTVIQFLWQGYSDVARQVDDTVVGNILQVVSVALRGVLAIYILVLGKNLLFNEIDSGVATTRIVRALVVAALMTPGTFGQYVTTFFTQTIPDAIAQAVSGQQNITQAQGFDALINEVTHTAASIRAQAIGVFYIGDRVAIWIVEMGAKALIAICAVIWALSQVVIYFVVPLLAFLAPTYLFDSTRGFAERAIGKIISLFLVQALTLMVAAVVVQQDAAYLKQFGAMVAARPPDQGFSMPGFQPDMGFGAVGAPDAAAAGSANVDGSIELLVNFLVVSIFGLFLLSLTTTIGFAIGASSGFSAGAALRSITSAATRAVSASAGAAGSAGRAIGRR